jgi:hypothetical protein
MTQRKISESYLQQREIGADIPNPAVLLVAVSIVGTSARIDSFRAVAVPRWRSALTK